MKHYLFSYGTLQKQQVQQALFGRTLQGWKDVLEGYKISTIEITDEAFLAKGEERHQKTLTASHNPNDVVQGSAFEITEEELLTADTYEPANYHRLNVSLRSGKKAWIYLASPTLR